MTPIAQSSNEIPAGLETRLKTLTAAQVVRIDALLGEVGEFGEVHRVVERQQLRYINQVQNYKADEGAPSKK